VDVNIAIGSVLGASEYVAEAVEAMLKTKGYNATCHFTPSISDINLEQLLVIITSTHGAGDLPDNIQPFINDLAGKDLTGVRAIIIGLGDSSYDTFCAASLTVESTIVGAGGSLLFPVFQIDVLHHPIPEELAVEWLSTKLSTITA